MTVSPSPSVFHFILCLKIQGKTNHPMNKPMMPIQETREINDESERLILRTEPSTTHTDANIWNASAARVRGLQQPILSCVANTFSHTPAIVFRSFFSSRQNYIDGIDRTSFFPHDQAPRRMMKVINGWTLSWVNIMINHKLGCIINKCFIYNHK